MAMSSLTLWPLTMDRALSRASAMWSGSSTPATRNQACCQAKRASSRRRKNSRLYRPRPKWKIAAPCMTVLSRSKKAAARSSPATGNSGAAASCGSAVSASGAVPAVSAGAAGSAARAVASSAAGSGPASVSRDSAVLRAASAEASPASTLRAVAERLRGVSHPRAAMTRA